MPDQMETTVKSDPITQPFVDFWSDYVQQANETTRELLEGLNGKSDVKSWQRRWLDAVSKSTDAFLRSPAFLKAMKENTDLLVKAKQRSDDLTAEIARNANIPTASDISGLFERMRCRCEEHEHHGVAASGNRDLFDRLDHVSELILSRLNSIENRVATIEEKIGAGQGIGH